MTEIPEEFKKLKLVVKGVRYGNDGHGGVDFSYFIKLMYDTTLISEIELNL